jgi:hypothetical protein
VSYVLKYIRALDSLLKRKQKSKTFLRRGDG